MDTALRALLTPREIKEIENRIQIFELLSKNIPQRDIAVVLGVGVATVTRGAHANRDNQFSLIAPYLDTIDDDTD